MKKKRKMFAGLKIMSTFATQMRNKLIFIEDVPKLFPIILMYSTKDGAFISCHLLLLV